LKHRPRKRFGQHFLHDPRVTARILAAIDPQPGERVVEIGPGLGMLTCPLLQRLGELDVVEIDRDLIPELQRRCGDLGELRVHCADALRFEFQTLSAAPGTLRVVGNLPYNISTPLLFHLLEVLPSIRDMHFMLQQEVVERITASPGGKDYGRLSVMLQFHCEAEYLFDVGRGAFSPQPQVQSAVLRLRPRPSPPVALRDPAVFATLVQTAFSHRRKTLRNALRGLTSPEAIVRAGIDPALRPEQLGVADYARLSNALSPATPVP
jgi:16S rRNA (adenine1518-N6/adenine1519-N6)-dimethyltransferase